MLDFTATMQIAEFHPEDVADRIAGMRIYANALANQDADLEHGIERITRMIHIIETDIVGIVGNEEDATTAEFLEVLRRAATRAQWSRRLVNADLVQIQNHIDELVGLATDWNMQPSRTRQELTDANLESDGTTYIIRHEEDVDLTDGPITTKLTDTKAAN